MKKFVKICLISTICIFSSCLIGTSGYLGSMYLKYSKESLDSTALSSPSTQISILDTDNRPIKEDNSTNSSFVKLNQLNPNTYEAFISIEDKTFYKHNGINLKRILKASINNLKSMSFKQGASTISQQLIKNTHLSSEKTIKRKIHEIALTKKLERSMNKNEILETYLNIIYFGNNCYGLEEASNYYFSKPSKNLSLSESATLAGMINSPNKYSPINHEEKCIKRRNLVLDEMLKDKKITQEECIEAKKQPIHLTLNSENENCLNSYSESAIDEAISILKLPAKQIALAGYKIHTYQNKGTQEKLEKSLDDVNFKGADYAGIVIDNQSHGVTGYIGNSAYKILNAKRQPGSCIKPLLCYAPALNENIISPSTQILDEEIKIGEYSPKNINGKLHGYISAREALSKSINIPAVKVLSYLGIDKAKNYASKMGIEFDESDNSYSLALGGMTYGVNLKQLASAYSTFANKGNFSEAKFVSYITTKDGKLLYRHIPTEKNILREDSSYLITSMLEESATSGTAKKLSGLVNIASKTGTVGKKGSKLNLDAWNISYTPNEVCGVWCGNLDNSPISISGGNEPTVVVKNYFSGVKTQPFDRPTSIVERDIDLTELEDNHRVALASDFTPERFKKTEIFSTYNLPIESSNFSTLPKTNFKTKLANEKKYLFFDAKKFMKYEIFDKDNNLLSTISEKEGYTELPIDVDEIKVKTTYIGTEISSENTFKFIQQSAKNNQPKQKRWWEKFV